MRKILFLILLFIGDFVFSQNITIEKNPFFKGKGYILRYIIQDSTFLDVDSTIHNADFNTIFIVGESLFLDSLCNCFLQWDNQGYMKNDSLFKKEILKLQYYSFKQRPFKYCFRYPKKDSISVISTYLSLCVRDDTLNLSNIKKGAYYRIIKVKMEGWLINFHDYKQLKQCYAPTSIDKNGKMIITSTILKDFEPAFRIYKEPYTIIYPKKVLFYSDWILSPKDADVIEFFYKHLYIGKEKEHISYPKALKYLLEHDDR